MKTLFRFLLAALIAPAQSGPAELFGQIDAITAELSRISGLKMLRKVPHSFIDRAGLKSFLEGQIKAHIKPDEIKADETTLRKFGFVPRDFDLARTTVDLLTEQAAALYDFRKKRLFVIEGNSSALQKIALVHELAHALADQHFNLEKFIERGARSDDGSLGRAAVMEGQATWLMSEYMAAQMGQSLKNMPGLVDLMSRTADQAVGQYPVLDKAPLYLRETLAFPYTRGMVFQHRVFEKLGAAAFAEVFRRPPISSQQVLHPEKYFDAAQPTRPRLPSIPDQREYRTYTEGNVGELDFSILIRQYGSEQKAGAIAPKWRGGSYKLLEHKRDKRLVLTYAVEWEDAGAADEYFEFYRKVLAGKWQTLDVGESSSDRLTGRGDDGRFVVRREGRIVTSVEGLPAAP